ncbi:NADPH-dependent diflavin oxidoreductase 1 [Physocladia obscura]|uniref:NADPH-dependent diflavin oxidoreductase 1 n=1 Tax=Physocladia obscura TaxID=109957 RepID=A0AAD5T8D3_9FUNG|nr:NADPH-dependent diflavin oxidoreductase 1 [Physocladia obscura]
MTSASLTADRYRGSVRVWYASETGSAAEWAADVAREACRRGFRVGGGGSARALDDIHTDSESDDGACALTSRCHYRYRNAPLPHPNVLQHPNTILVFVVSTTGQGEAPRNMRRWWRRVLNVKTTQLRIFESRQVAVVGLGDSAYPRFNWAAKKLARRLLNLGAMFVAEPAYADDQHPLGADHTLLEWAANFWPALDKLCPKLPLFVEPSRHILPSPAFTPLPPLYPVADSSSQTPLDNENNIDDDSNACANLNYATCKSNSRISAVNHFQDVRRISFEVSENTRYSPADILCIYPSNPPEEIVKVIDFFGWADIADKPFALVQNGDIKIPTTFPKNLTLRSALTHHLDIFGAPKRYFFELLSFFTPDVMHADKLREFASPAGQEELYTYCHRLRRTTFEVLMDFHSCKGRIPPAYLFDLIPPMRPRMYSISSAPQSTSGSNDNSSSNSNGNNGNAATVVVDITVGIVVYKTKMQKLREGVCSKMLARIKSGDRVWFRIDAGTLKIPKDPNVAVIFVAAGTGIAPMRSLLLARIQNGSSENILFAGFRGKKSDHLYGNEFEELQNVGKLSYFPAFSRDDPNKIVYIQHRMGEQAQLIWDILQLGGSIFVSGNAQRIPKAVDGALVEIFQKVGKMDEPAALEHLAKLEKSRQYQSECWV